MYLKHLNFHIVLLLTFTSCSYVQSQDPLKDIKFGQDSLSHVEKIISEIDNSWALKKYSKYIDDNYGNQIVSSIRIPLSSDSSYLGKELFLPQYIPQSFSHLKSLWDLRNPKKYACSGPLPSSIIDSLWNLYHKWYGTPDYIFEVIDTLYIKNGKYSSFPIETTNIFSRSIGTEVSYKGLLEKRYDILKRYVNSPIDTIIIDTENIKRKAFWNTKNYQVSFYYPYKHRSVYDSTQLYCEGAEINYKMNNYEEVIKHLEDSIRKSYKIDDLIWLGVRNFMSATDLVHWTDYAWGAFTTIGRPANLDQRFITSVRYEIIMKDAYGEELYRSTPQTLDIVKDALEGATTCPMPAGATFYNSYLSCLIYDSKLLEVREYAKHHKVTYSMNPIAVIFSTGEVLRRNN